MEKKRKLKNSRRNKRIIFYVSILALPIIQFLIFYVYVNFDSIILAFQSYSYREDGGLGYNVTFAGFANFQNVFNILKEKPQLLQNSLTLAACELFIGIPLALLFSYYIYKKRMFGGWFRVLLFLPQIISSTVFVIIAKILMTEALPYYGLPNLLDVSTKTELTRFVLIVFTLFLSFGTNVLLFTGSMTNISPSLIEASELDGCNPIQELFHVTIPCIFPTVVTFIIMVFSSIFVHQMYLYTFALGNDRLWTIGFYLYNESSAKGGGLVPQSGKTASFSTLSAFSLLITLILFPLSFGIRKLLTKFGPSTR